MLKCFFFKNGQAVQCSPADDMGWLDTCMTPPDIQCVLKLSQHFFPFLLRHHSSHGWGVRTSNTHYVSLYLFVLVPSVVFWGVRLSSPNVLVLWSFHRLPLAHSEDCELLNQSRPKGFCSTPLPVFSLHPPRLPYICQIQSSTDFKGWDWSAKGNVGYKSKCLVYWIIIWNCTLVYILAGIDFSQVVWVWTQISLMSEKIWC